MTITKEQCKAARAYLNWSREELAKKAMISARTLFNFECGARTPLQNNLLAIEHALQEAGIYFEADGRVGLKKNSQHKG